MKCQVCGSSCLKKAAEITRQREERFSPCPSCRSTVLNKQSPPPSYRSRAPCSACEKRPLDEVVADCWTIMAEEGDLAPPPPPPSWPQVSPPHPSGGGGTHRTAPSR
ncbi:hypothetical protein [Methanogenium cariaci]|uniref:hypothetical protein n=1 Tax=Methanogenium cariaci TaxID=2197 RepID=UPI0007826EC4|nr:hypothetical protein [Methanogenium cariaci]